MKQPGKKTLLLLEIILWVMGILLVLFLGTVLILQIPAVQQKAAQKLTAYLAGKLKTKVSVGRFTTDWKNSVVLKDFYLEDKRRDTLVYAQRLGIDLDISALLGRKLKVRSAKIENAVVNLYTTMPDTAFNFSFIREAFQSGNTQEKTADTLDAFGVKLNSLQLENVRFNLHDPVRGNEFQARIGLWKVTFREFDPAKRVYQLQKFILENSWANYTQTKLRNGASRSPTLNFGFDKIVLKKVRFHYENQLVSQRIVARIGDSELKADNVDLKNAKVELSVFELNNSAFAYYHDKRIPRDSLAVNLPRAAAKLDKTAEIAKGKPLDWSVWLKELKFSNVGFIYGNYNTPQKPRGLDFNHLKFTGVNLELLNIYYHQNRLAVYLQQLQLLEKSGLTITGFKGKINAAPSVISLQDFELKTRASLLRGGLMVAFPAKKPVSDPKVKPTFNATFNQAKIAAPDILYFAPSLAGKPFMKKLSNRPLLLHGQVSGQASALQFKQMQLKGWSGTNLFFSGNVFSLASPENRVMSLRIHKLTTNKSDLNTLLANGKNPKIRFPAQITLSGNVQSRKNKLGFQQLHVTASNGTVLNTSGSVSGAANNKYSDLHIKNLATNRTALLSMLPAGIVTPEVQLPEKIRIAGTYKGYSVQNFSGDWNIHTSFGNVYAKIKVRPVQQFSGHISLDNFNLGKLLKQENTIGPATGKADFQGKGFKVKTMQLHYDADVKKFVYKKETYRNIQLEGNLNQKIYQLHGNLGNAALQGLGHKLKQVKPKNLDLKKADPTRLIPKNIEPKKIIPKKMIPKIFRKKEKKQEGEK